MVCQQILTLDAQSTFDVRNDVGPQLLSSSALMFQIEEILLPLMDGAPLAIIRPTMTR